MSGDEPLAAGEDDRRVASDDRWLVPLPRAAEPPYRVFVNGVAQTEGVDYEVRGRKLAFPRPLQKEGKLGFWRWLLMFLSIAGTYRRNDSVDVQYTFQGRDRVATGLEIVPPKHGSDAASPDRG
jgi:hypothetical protein